MIIKEGLVLKAIPYLEHAYKVTGNVPGINYLLASCYLHAGSGDRGYDHLAIALDTGKDLYNEFSDLFPSGSMTAGIARLLEKYDLI